MRTSFCTWVTSPWCVLYTNFLNYLSQKILKKDGPMIDEALRTYAVRWLPDSIDAMVSDDHVKRNRSLLLSRNNNTLVAIG